MSSLWYQGDSVIYEGDSIVYCDHCPCPTPPPSSSSSGSGSASGSLLANCEDPATSAAVYKGGVLLGAMTEYASGDDAPGPVSEFCNGDNLTDAYPAATNAVWYLEADGRQFYFWQEDDVGWHFTEVHTTCDDVRVVCEGFQYTYLGSGTHEWDQGTYEVRWTA